MYSISYRKPPYDIIIITQIVSLFKETGTILQNGFVLKQHAREQKRNI